MTALILTVWGIVVGLDLATGPQSMIARPFVAGTIAGALLGDVAAGAVAGGLLELFALDYLPVGAAQYPDYGIGAIAAAAAGAGAPGLIGVGVAAAVGLATAYVGEVSITIVRRLNTADVRRHAAALDAGDPAAVGSVHWWGIARDVVRALVVTSFGLALAGAVRAWLPMSLRGTLVLAAVAVGIALAVGVRGTVQMAGTRGGWGWMTAGLVAGAIWAFR